MPSTCWRWRGRSSAAPARPVLAHRTTSATPSQRQLKVAEAVRHELAAWLARGDVHDAALTGASLTMSEVRMSRDLKHADVLVSLLGVDRVPDAVLGALDRAAGPLAGRLARSLHLKFAPKLRFVTDDRYATVERLETLMRRERDIAENRDGN